jgi:hypothetical protein
MGKADLTWLRRYHSNRLESVTKAENSHIGIFPDEVPILSRLLNDSSSVWRVGEWERTSKEMAVV